MNRPVLVVIDIQKEYTTPNRPFFIENIQPSLAAAQNALKKARAQNWTVIHVQHLQQSGGIFNSDSEFSQFVPDFEPLATEATCVKSNFSSFSSPQFVELMASLKDSDIYVIGYGSGMCCLSTIIDGYHRGFKMHFVKDASNAKAKSFDSVTTHAHMTDAISTFAKVVDACELV